MNRLVPKLPAHAVSTIHQFLRAHALSEGATGVVVGMSGGVDSALTVRLARDALRPGPALGVLLPDARFPPALRTETEEYARFLGVETRTVPIDRVERAYRELLPEIQDRVTIGNTSARVRMTIDYALARERGRLVAGTGNKSELLLGYFTKYGDGGAALLPIGDLYKTQLRALATQLGLPRTILDRAPSAGFWEGQTDEGELGDSYADLDRILYGIEQLCGPEEIHERTGLPMDAIRRVEDRGRLSRHKRRLPPVTKLGLRTVGLDWRE